MVSIVLYVAIVLQFCHAVSFAQLYGPGDLVACLSSIPGLDISLPGSSTYDQDRQTFELLTTDESYPAAVVTPSDVGLLKAAVRCARMTRVRVVAKNGGCSYEANSVQNGTLSVVLSNLNDIVIDKNSQTATVGGGALLGAVAYEAYAQAGMGFSASETPNNGVSGTLLGGGSSYFSRKEGLGCDQVVSLQMMTWEGRIITATETNKYADLFWASCGGGGGNFGIVTSWTLKLMSVPDLIHFGDGRIYGDLDVMVQGMYFFQMWIAGADNALGVQVHFGPERSPGLKFPFVYSGDGNIQEYLSSQLPLSDFGNVTIKYRNASYINAVTSLTGWGLKAPEDLADYDWSQFRRMRKIKTVFVYEPYTRDLIKELYQSLVDMYYAQGNIKFIGAGGKIAERSPTASAFPHREALGWFIFQASWDPSNSTEGEAASAWLDAVSSIISNAGYEDFAYVNYMDDSIENWQQAYFRFNYPKLTQVKTAYDPKDMFTFEDQGIQRDGLNRCVFQPCVQDT